MPAGQSMHPAGCQCGQCQGKHGMCLSHCGCGHKSILRWVIGLVILGIVFCAGFKLGQLRGAWYGYGGEMMGWGRGNWGGYGYPMMRGARGYYGGYGLPTDQTDYTETTTTQK